LFSFVFGNEKGVKHSIACSLIWHRQVTMHVNKQEQFTPNGRELQQTKGEKMEIIME
jgi:hypothetical protein